MSTAVVASEGLFRVQMSGDANDTTALAIQNMIEITKISTFIRATENSMINALELWMHTTIFSQISSNKFPSNLLPKCIHKFDGSFCDVQLANLVISLVREISKCVCVCGRVFEC